MTGEVDGIQLINDLLLISAIIMVIPIILVYSSLTLPDRVNQWINILLAIFLFIFDFVGLFTFTSAYGIFLIIVGLVFCILIVWNAWKWPKQESKINL
jgi:hypothetical protein